MEAWQQCTESAITLAAPTQPQEETCPTAALAITKALRARVRQVWRLSWENNRKEVWWRLLQHGVVGAGGHGWPMKRETACPCGWQHSAASPRAAQALQLREHILWTCTDASYSHQASHITQPSSFRAAATMATARVAATASVPNSEEGSAKCGMLCASLP